MTRDEFRNILIEEMVSLLNEMRENGFYYRSEVRYDATTWDINNGLCEEYFKRVEKRVPDICEPDHTPLYESLNHVVIKWRGRYYDAECIDGVRGLKQLPIYLNRDKKRAEVLAEREITDMAAEE